MARVYVDSGVLILAATALESDVAERALRELDREDADFLFCSLVELETLPRPTHNRRDTEKQFYLDFFEEAERVVCGEREQQAALALMIQKNGLECIDALHLASAIAGQATEFVTAEGITKPLVNIDVPALAIRTVRVSA